MEHGLGRMSKRVGFLGPFGTYSEEAARQLFPGNSSFLPYHGIDAVIQAVAASEAGVGVVPIENSLEGAVNLTLDTLAHDAAVFITAEIIMPIRHNLLTLGDEDVKIIVSHPQALAQCRKTMGRLFPKAELRPVVSTAEAARLVASDRPGFAAIGSRLAAEMYKLEIRVPDIQDTSTNCTRFVALEKSALDSGGSGRWKTSVVCQVNGERPGSLCEILREFAERGVNMTRIESRPARTGLGNYIFFFDLDGHLNEAALREAWQAVCEKSIWFKSFGSYRTRDWEE